MANDLFSTARDAFLGGEIDWADGGATVTVAALSSTLDSTDLATMGFADELSDVEDTATVSGRAILPGGIADADDTSFASVGVGVTIVAIAIYLDTGTPATSQLIAYADTNDDSTPMSRTSTGAAIPLLWSNSTNRVFRL